jgi:hypothetical protein
MRRTLSAAVALGAAGLAGAVLAAPASASVSPAALSNVTPVVSCVAAVDAGTTRVFFGYYNSTGSTKTYTVGKDNSVTRDGAVLASAGQTTNFLAGDHPAAFFVDVPNGSSDAPGRASWEIDYLQANYNHNLAVQGRYATCGPDVELSATGNGMLPVAGAGAVGLLAAGVLVLGLKRRQGA